MLLSLLPSAALAADTQQIALMAVTQDGFLIEPGMSPITPATR